MPAVVEHVEFLGAELLVHARVDGAVVVARVPATSGVAVGSAVRLGVDWGAALLFAPDGGRIL